MPDHYTAQLPCRLPQSKSCRHIIKHSYGIIHASSPATHPTIVPCAIVLVFKLLDEYFNNSYVFVYLTVFQLSATSSYKYVHSRQSEMGYAFDQLSSLQSLSKCILCISTFRSVYYKKQAACKHLATRVNSTPVIKFKHRLVFLPYTRTPQPVLQPVFTLQGWPTFLGQV